MARKIRFPLKMKNGAEVRTLDELKENFDIETVLGYFTDGKLATWLADRYYDEKAEAVSALSADTPELNAKLCNILEVEYQGDDDVADLEYIQRRNEKYRILSAKTDDSEILDNIDIVALNQVDLYDVLDGCNEKVYLYGNKFEIPFGRKNICYIGLSPDRVVDSIEKGKYQFEYIDAGITFHNIEFDSSINQYVTKGEILLKNNKYEESIPLIKKAMKEGNIRAFYLLKILDELSIANIKEKEYEEVINIIGDNSIGNDTFEALLLRLFRDKDKKIYGGEVIDNPEKVDDIIPKALEKVKSYAYSGDFIALIYLFRYGAHELIDSEIISIIELCDNAILYGGLGELFYEKKDNINAIKYFEKSYKLGYYLASAALFVLGYISEDDVTDSDAQYKLGDFYRYTNDAEAVKWYRKAAEQGNADAQYKLGDCYRYGDGVEEDDTQADKWFRKAAEQGNADAQYKLGDCYRYINDAEAVKWYRKAAEQGNADAQKQLVYMHENGYGVTPDKKTAEEWYGKAAEKKSAKEKKDFNFDMAELLKAAEEEAKKRL